MKPLLNVRKLRVSFQTHGKRVIAVNDTSFTLNSGEKIGLVGESGSGKSVLAQSILLPTGTIEGGEVWFEGENLLVKSNKQMRSIRGKKIGIIFQDPLTSLNPTMSIGNQIMENILEHENASRSEAREKAIELLHRVGLSHPQQRFGQYPFELSGGMRQRVMIAIAIACDPLLIIADEPTTALDVTVQAQIIELLEKIVSSQGVGLLFITHDLGLVAGLCDKVMVMSKGEIVEEGLVDQIFYHPSHPYTCQLLAKRRMC